MISARGKLRSVVISKAWPNRHGLLAWRRRVDVRSGLPRSAARNPAETGRSRSTPAAPRATPAAAPGLPCQLQQRDARLLAATPAGAPRSSRIKNTPRQVPTGGPCPLFKLQRRSPGPSLAAPYKRDLSGQSPSSPPRRLVATSSQGHAFRFLIV